ncbi:MAG: DedA family protein [Betaproteobacteria bacterium]|nr:DedA family protein [Betaproteobacteria bacterium]MDE2623185.1 DedA family protein [Betaproteobacteria bacterium]
MHEISQWIASYGYWVVFLGTLLEGETVLLAAGYSAQRGLLDWRMVVALACVGATLGDQLAFALGRWKGMALVNRFPGLARRVPALHRLLERYHVSLILIIRFLYGFRIAGPVILGTTRLPLARFSALNLLGALLWSFAVAGAGYFFGVALESLVANVEEVEFAAAAVLLLAGFVLGWWLSRRATRAAPPDQHSG